MIKSVVLYSIKSYKKYISPYKGWRCAHAYVYGGHSCSSYGLVVINEHGILEGYSLLKARFRECSKANAIYKKHIASMSLASNVGSNFMDIPPELIDFINSDLFKEGFGKDTGDCIGDCCTGIFD